MKKSTQVLNSEGKKYFDSGQVSEAIKSFKLALELDPKFYEGWFNLGLVYQKLNRFKEAIECYNKNIENYAPNHFALKNLVLCYGLAGETKKALKIAKILSREGNDWLTYFNLGTTCQIAGEIEEGIKNYQKAIELNPSFGLSYGQLYNLYSRVCAWDEANLLVPKIEKFNLLAMKTGVMPAELPFTNISREQNPKNNLQIAKLKSEDVKNKTASSSTRFIVDNRSLPANRRIRIGYLSSDYHDHATVHLISGLLRLHNREKFEIFAYSYGVDDNTKYRKAVVDAVDYFREISGLNDKEAAITIYRDAIDILVDLKGHTHGARLGIMVFRPAPINVTWLGFPGTTGGNFIDYIIADRVVIPKSETKYFSEKVLYMPNSYQVNDNEQKIQDMNTATVSRFKRKDFGLPEKGFVFSSFNQAYKITPETFASWMNILRKVPGSVLWLFEKLPISTRNLKNEAKKAGIDPSRLIFAGNLPKEEHLARIKLADLALDTFTYNGHTTTSDCLWAGVPVITLEGHHFASRVSASLLMAIGLPKLITHSSKEYEALAIKLATNPKKLAAIQKSLILNRKSCALFDTQRFTLNLEKAYSAIYKRFISAGKIRELMIN